MAMVATVQRRLHYISDVRRRHGARTLAKVLVDRLVCEPMHASLVNLIWLNLADLRLTYRPASPFVFRFLTADEIRRYAADPASGLLPDFVAERLATGRDRCFAALAGDRLAAYGWTALESIEARHASGVGLSYPGNVAYHYSSFTCPDFRGQRLHGCIHGLGLQQLAAQWGVTNLLGMVDWTNSASMHSLSRIGYVSLGWLLVIRLGSRQLVLAPRAAGQRGLRIQTLPS
jgi:hypothetical protein